MADVIDFLDLRTLMRLYGKRAQRVGPRMPGRLAAARVAWSPFAPVLPWCLCVCGAAPFVVWPSFIAHMTNVRRHDLTRVLNNVEKVPTPVSQCQGHGALPV
jgi:hypothetical protein